MKLKCWTRSAVFVAATLLLAGCGDDRFGEITGAVRIDGQPIEQGSILFIPLEGTPPVEWGGPIENGQYKAKVPIGLVKVTISSLKDTGKKKKFYDSPEAPEKAIFEQAIPTRYNLETELKYEVKSGKHQKDWDLTR